MDAREAPAVRERIKMSFRKRKRYQDFNSKPASVSNGWMCQGMMGLGCVYTQGKLLPVGWEATIDGEDTFYQKYMNKNGEPWPRKPTKEDGQKPGMVTGHVSDLV